MTRHPWVARADDGVRFGVQLYSERGYAEDPFRALFHEDQVPKLIEMGKATETLGLDGVFIPDHPLRMPDPWVVLSGLATVTNRIYLGSVVLCAGYRHPTTTARLASDLDHLSGGRLMLGLGIGWDRREFAALQIPFPLVPERQAALEEAVAIVEGVWGEEPFTFEGSTYAVTEVHVEPPVQRPRPPLMIAGGGERTTLRQVARLADACNFDEIERGGVEVVRHKLEVLRRHCEEVGRPYDEILRTHYTNWLILAPTEDDVRAKVARYFPGKTRQAWDQRMASSFSAATPGVADRMIVAATPAQAIAYYRARADAGIQYFVVTLFDGNDRETLDLLGREVVPHVH